MASVAVPSRELTRVGVGPRAGALVLDFVVLGFVAGIPLAILFGHKTTVSVTGSTLTSYTTNRPAVLALWGLIGLVYFAVFEAATGATIGKLILHFRVRRVDGSPISWRDAIVRNLFRVVDGIPYIVPYLLGSWVIWSDANRQRIGDRVAKTIVTYKHEV